MSKVTLIGGGGVRTPLLVHGIAEAAESLGIRELHLYDVQPDRLEVMAALCREVVRAAGADLQLRAGTVLEAAVSGAAYVFSSIRVGGIHARAADERLAIQHGVAGQETTGVGGWAMALRTVPVVLQQARVIEREAPGAWLLSLTNPAGLVTQTLLQHTKVRAVGVCDTPSELFHQIAHALGAPPSEVQCDYLGLNHLGWVRRVRLRGEDVTARLLADDALLRSLYPAPLFAPELIRDLGLIPTEYLFFYYRQHHAWSNQQAVGASRGAEIAAMNDSLFASLSRELSAGRADTALETYRQYLRQRSGSYMRLESEGQSGLALPPQQQDVFSAATGYHKIALSVMHGLQHGSAEQEVVNVRNGGAITDIAPDDVVEVPCRLSPSGPQPLAAGSLPPQVRGLVHAVKEYERAVMEAAVTGSRSSARLALLLYPIVGQWDAADRLTRTFIEHDPQHLGYLQ